MKKENLMAGYAIKYRNGEIRIVVNIENNGVCLVSPTKNGWNTLALFNDDLLNVSDEDLDIVEVFGFSDHPLYALEFKEDTRRLLWKRDEHKIVRVIKTDSSQNRYMTHLPENTKINDILIPFNWTDNDVYINGGLISYPEAQLTLKKFCNRDNTDSVRITIMPKTKEMTVAEIEKALGYRVKIVK